MGNHVVSLYELEGLANVKSAYRLMDIEGSYGAEVAEGDLAEKNLNLLVKQVAIRERAPVAIIHHKRQRVLAMPAAHVLSELQCILTPHVVTLRPRDEVFGLDFGNLTGETRQVGLAFLMFHLRSPLIFNPTVWRSGTSTYFPKSPINWRDEARDADVYRGFGFRLIWRNGKGYLSLWLTHKYVDNAWLIDRWNVGGMQSLKMRHFLYQFGNKWYPVQLLGPTGKSIEDQQFEDRAGAIRNVYEYTVAEAGANPPNWVRNLDQTSPAIAYRYPGRTQTFYGAAALCRLLLNNQDPAVQKLHSQSIIPPDRRFGLVGECVEKSFDDAKFEGHALRIRREPLKTGMDIFRIPDQQFGNGQVLRVKDRKHPDGTELAEYGRVRMGYLLDPRRGAALSKGFDQQYLVAPEGVPRGIVEDFRDRLEKTVRQMSQMAFSLQPVLFKDAGARTLKQQVDAIVGALDGVGVREGHAVLILPDRAAGDLHNFIKRKVMDRLQMQCVTAGNLRSFYKMVPRNGKAEYVVDGESSSHYASVVRYTALGLLIVNRQWPWTLNEKMAYDAYVGVDVLHNTAAFTFFYEGGQRCFVRTQPSKQKEKLLRSQARSMIYQGLAEDLAGGMAPPRSIVMHRDGHAFRSEWLGLQDAVQQLVQEGRLPASVTTGIVEIHKHSAMGVRLAAERQGALCNPKAGSWFEVSDTEGIVCLTGWPFRLRGTVNPLFVRIAYGNLSLRNVLQDIFWMSQLCWMVPDRCIRLPIDLKLCDDFLRSAAAEADDDEAEFGEENSETEGDDTLLHI